MKRKDGKQERRKEGALPLTLIQLLNSRQSTQSSNTTAATAQYSETLPLSTRLFFKAAEMSSRILKAVPAVNNVKISSTYHQNQKNTLEDPYNFKQYNVSSVVEVRCRSFSEYGSLFEFTPPAEPWHMFPQPLSTLRHFLFLYSCL